MRTELLGDNTSVRIRRPRWDKIALIPQARHSRMCPENGAKDIKLLARNIT